VNCAVGEWVSWGSCNTTCGGGNQNRTRTIITPASCGGTACPATNETTPCNTNCCSVNCVVGEWVSWGSCDATCGGGTLTRIRSIQTPASCGGTACPATTGTIDCNTNCCPVSCVVGEWVSWGSCSSSCGGGQQLRQRRILTQPSCGGYSCPSTSDNRACNSQGCPSNCVTGEWRSWASCTKSCGSGTKYRTRAVMTPASNGGTSCGTTSETVSCNTQSCGRY